MVMTTRLTLLQERAAADNTMNEHGRPDQRMQSLLLRVALWGWHLAGDAEGGWRGDLGTAVPSPLHPLQKLAEGFLCPPPSGLVQADSLEQPELFFAGLLPGEGEVASGVFPGLCEEQMTGLEASGKVLRTTRS